MNVAAVKSSPSKQCASDPLPTWLLEQAMTTLAPYITNIFNSTLAQGYFPHTWRHAIVTPLMKKAGLVESLPSSYRPVSNLPFLSKVLERIVNRQIVGYLSDFHRFPDVQSPYRRGHSTETAVLKVFSDIIDGIADGKIVFLSLLDLTAAFDTVDHDILLKRLEITYCLSGTILDWLRTYVKGRTQAVHMCGGMSFIRRVTCGVPQGSVLGPLLFTLYTTDIEVIVSSFGLTHLTYADDNQIYIVVPST